MKHRSRLIALAALLFAAAVPASANIAPPSIEKKPRQTTGAPIRMHVRPDANAKEAKLIIPRKVLQQLRAEVDGGAEAQAAAAVAPAGGSKLSSTQTAVAGLFLSLSLVTGGVWLAGARGGGQGRRASRVASALVFAALGGAAAGGAAVYANAGPPPEARSLTSKILSADLAYWGASGVVKIEVADDESLIMLVLPKGKDAAPSGE